MATPTKKSVSKISIRVWVPVLDALDQRIEAACLRRDAYLNKVLAEELKHLDREVSIPNSDAARKFVANRLDQLDRKAVSLALQPELVELLDDICARKRIVRDAFFNRIFLLLAAKPRLIDALLFPSSSNWRTEVWSGDKHDGPFFQNVFYPLDPDIDPFWPIRRGIELFADEEDSTDYVEPESGTTIRVKKGLGDEVEPVSSVYTTFFELKMKDADICGLNCYVPDFRVPNHPAELRHRQQLDDIFEDLEDNGLETLQKLVDSA
nr:hypothetical protein pM02_c6_27 [uncultured bacterium]